MRVIEATMCILLKATALRVTPNFALACADVCTLRWDEGIERSAFPVQPARIRIGNFCWVENKCPLSHTSGPLEESQYGRSRKKGRLGYESWNGLGVDKIRERGVFGGVCGRCLNCALSINWGCMVVVLGLLWKSRGWYGSIIMRGKSRWRKES